MTAVGMVTATWEDPSKRHLLQPVQLAAMAKLCFDMALTNIFPWTRSLIEIDMYSMYNIHHSNIN